MNAASRVLPMLSVADLNRSLQFYRDVLGGELAYQFPPEGEPGFVTLGFGETQLGIGLLVDRPLHGVPQRPATGHRIELCIYVADPDAAAKAIAATGAHVVMQPQDLPWGERAGYVEDPDGNLVMLASTAR
jgi:lactoylglutathione lyase